MIRTGSRLQLALLAVIPGVLTALLTLLILTSKHIGELSYFIPDLPLISIFYWGMQHPRSMPYWFVFALGLASDAITGLPLGSSSLLNLLFLAMLHTQQSSLHKEGFAVKWACFAMLLTMIECVNWAMLSLFFSAPQRMQPAFLQWLLTLCCYPALHKLFEMLNALLQIRRWKIMHGR